MKRTISFFLLLVSMQSTMAQSDSVNINTGEFKIYDNGLIYSESTLSKIKILVDSLNLRFKSCEPTTFRSLEQGYGTYLSITKSITKAREAILQNIPLDQFMKRFPTAKVIRDTWIVKSRNIMNGRETVTYFSLNEDYQYLHPGLSGQNQTEGWVYEDHGDRIEAFYLYKLKSYPIPKEYAKLIQYVDCMIDTTATIFIWKPFPDSLTYALSEGSNVKEFINIAMDFEPEPSEPSTEGLNVEQREKVYEKYQTDFDQWNARRMSALDKKMQNLETSKIFYSAVEEAIVNQNGFYLDEYAERYLPAAKKLELKRSFRVHGFCSADTRPRRHAQAICVLAAESRQWDIFLRAHLDILNDNFSRNSDGSYAWHSRGTYMKELEEVGINSIELLVGTTLHSKDISKNHYMANTSRVGRALAESKYRVDAENLLLHMAQDERLDPFNRMEMLYVLLFCNRYSKDQEVFRSNLPKIKKAISSLPKGIQSRYSHVLGD